MNAVLAFLFTSLIMNLLVIVIGKLRKRQILSTLVSRKFLHVSAGIVFLLHWPLFHDDDVLIVALIPLLMTLKFALNGLGIMSDADTINIMSRSGSKSELLKGPTMYGLVFVWLSLFRFKSFQSILVTAALCAGDGFAEVFGRNFGGKIRIPWNKSKSVAGSCAFMISTYLVSHMMSYLLGKHETMQSSLISSRIIFASIIGALFESLPIADYDNVIIAMSVIVFDHLHFADRISALSFL